MPFHRTILLSLAVMSGLLAPTAYAEDAPGVKSITPSSTGYAVAFDDDPLQAGGIGGVTTRIAILERASRSTLIRPRTAFVVELLKSVEKL
jgi:hypothetical protein